ncbi:MAG: MazG nucleotide pyrophosphohydrolase domain-containing protein, partial [Sedimenticolaceae bacterium]
DEVEAEVATIDPDRLQAELGDLLFAMVNVIRLLGMDAEQTLSRANEKFERRFRAMETLLGNSGRQDLRELSLEALDAAWEQVKEAEKGT